MNISIETALVKKEITDFLFCARNYCDFIEKKSNLNEFENLKILQTQLLELYITGRQIPEIALTYNLEFDSKFDKVTAANIIQEISNKVPFSYYWSVLNPLDNKNNAITGCGDLIDDLADIYIDIKKDLSIFDLDKIEAKEIAIWSFKFHYDNHWAEHCIEALFAIHHYFLENR